MWRISQGSLTEDDYSHIELYSQCQNNRGRRRSTPNKSFFFFMRPNYIWLIIVFNMEDMYSNMKLYNNVQTFGGREGLHLINSFSPDLL